MDYGSDLDKQHFSRGVLYCLVGPRISFHIAWFSMVRIELMVMDRRENRTLRMMNVMSIPRTEIARSESGT
jgi:hypothetical protein